MKSFVLGMYGISSVQTNTFPSSGNVGIGTTSPAGLLDVFASNAGGNVNVYFRNQPGTNTSGSRTTLNFLCLMALPVFRLLQ